MTSHRRPAAVLALLAVGAGCQPAPPAAAGVAVERLRVKVLAEHHHDPGAFCQGLVWHDGVLYESTGQYGRSSVRRVGPLSGTVLVNTPLDPLLFGEGLALVDGRLIQLTYQAGLALIYDAQDLVPLDQRAYAGEGWGLAYDGERLIMSDGSSRLTFRDPKTFEVQGALDVHLDGRPVAKLNELEVVDGAIFANVWMADWIARIDPASGDVTAKIDASGLLTPEERRRADVLNGIAYDPASKTFWITGKHWPKMFQVTFEPVP